ncbi:MAG TPA: hypothetical protein DCP35_18430 [Butyricimonas sp.]|uniref:ABC transporter permease n=1 Tax=Butyricimonas sp. TaxID=1969738 RepID=UPI000EC4056C|nr:ABC transporter permease [Butyricimonas sp.]HAM85888.1 hypothetical protein [Butyricimonas sp.]
MNGMLILLIAHYEGKLLCRNFIFLLLCGFMLLGITVFHVFLQSDWRVFEYTVNLPSGMPYANAYLWGIMQSFLVIFVVGDFVYRDNIEKTNDVFLARDFSNLEYLTGKLVGVVVAFLVLNVISMFICMLIHLFASSFKFNVGLYLFYLLTVSLPALLFMSGLAFMMKIWIKFRFFAFTVLVIFFLLSLFVFSTKALGVFDCMASRVPHIFSSMVGHPAMGSYLLHRLVFVLVGVGCFVISVYGFKRLPNNIGRSRRLGVVGLVFVLLGFLTGWLYWLPHQVMRETRSDWIAIQKKYDAYPKVKIDQHEIKYDIHGEKILAHSVISVRNSNSFRVDTVIFYLNPSLEITSVTAGNCDLNFTRNQQIVEIEKSLYPDERSELELSYSGAIDPQICYLDISPERYDEQEQDELFACYGKKFVFTGKAFTLLTPEVLWYPVSKPVTELMNPYVNTSEYTDYTLTVVPAQGNTVVSQGELTVSGDTSYFTNNRKLQGITLISGQFFRDSFRLAGNPLLFEFYGTKKSMLGSAWGDYLQALEWSLKRTSTVLQWMSPGGKYPFDKLAFVEEPVSFYAFERSWKEKNDYVHPEMQLYREWRGVVPSEFRRRMKKVKTKEEKSEEWFQKYILSEEYMSRVQKHDVPELSVKEILFNSKQERDRMWSEKLFSAWPDNKYSIRPLLMTCGTLITSDEVPVIHRMITIMQRQAEEREMALSDKLSYHWEGVKFLMHHSLWDALHMDSASFCMESVIYLKALQLQRYILTQVAWTDFSAFMDHFLKEHPFQEVSLDYFLDVFQARFNWDLREYIPQWLHERGVPKLLVRNFHMRRIQTENSEKRFVHFKVWNPTGVDAIVSLEAWESARKKIIDQHYLIEAGCAKEVNYYLMQPSSDFLRVRLNTNLSQNLPGEYENAMESCNLSRWDEGCFDCDTSLFCPSENEIIVDDEDEGFKVIKGKSFFFTRKWEGYQRHLLSPTSWSPVFNYDINSYGEFVRGFHCKGAGGKQADVEWNARIPRSGTYEMYIYVGMFLNDWVQPLHRYTFYYDGLEESITLNINGLSAGVKSVIYYVGKEPIELWTTPFNSRGGWGRPEYFN